MDSLIHLLNIGTFATSLSVMGFGTAGILLPDRTLPCAARPDVLTSEWRSQDFTIGAESAHAEPPVAEPAVTLAAPPSLADSSPSARLPDVPDLPPPSPPVGIAQMPPPHSRPSSAARTVRSSTGKPATGEAFAGGGGFGLSGAARLAAGSMPPPSYPAEARRLGQTGTLVVEFTIDTTGRVISARANPPSPWPLLNAEALSTVRRWQFPPGAVMKLQRPIVFQLR